ncbi:type III secretion protein [Pseudomonas sp. GL93]|uniref:type III secretion protein n=1 Tax=unclassified Pseudomonas TaxID=196821 RepID=UPI000E314996|nr:MULTISPECIES: type III secretion protein [unclassified Pseudomonas]RFD29806.1 type III secretion protein [Pseudomonas sp. GL93]
MLLQALGNFYSGIGMMLGGGQMGGACAKHSHNDSVSRRELSDALKSFKYDHSQPTSNITINNSVSNANSNANTNAQIGR